MDRANTPRNGADGIVRGKLLGVGRRRDRAVMVLGGALILGLAVGSPSALAQESPALQDAQETTTLETEIQGAIARSLTPSLQLFYGLMAASVALPVVALAWWTLGKKGGSAGRSRDQSEMLQTLRRELQQEFQQTLQRELEQVKTDLQRQNQAVLDQMNQELDRLRDRLDQAPNAVLETAIAASPPDSTSAGAEAELWYVRGNNLCELGRYDDALIAFEKALEARPDFYAAWANRAYVLDRMGRYREAIAAIDRALRLKPDYGGLWYNRGTILGKMQRHADAIAAFNRALRLKPNFVEAWNNRGTSLGKLQRYDEAIAAFDRALQLDPDFAGPHYGKACCYAAQNNQELAIEHLHRAVQLDPATYRDLARSEPDFDALRHRDLFTWLLSDEG
jgi:tetratricopeptide (TPR) repeat protein